VPHNLPRQLTSFVGREAEAAQVVALIDQTTLLTLAGPGGAAKTRLALQVAAQDVSEFEDGVWFDDLGALRDRTLVPQAVATVLGVRDHGARPVIDTLCELVRSRRSLLVMDSLSAAPIRQACSTPLEPASTVTFDPLLACPCSGREKCDQCPGVQKGVRVILNSDEIQPRRFSYRYEVRKSLDLVALRCDRGAELQRHRSQARAGRPAAADPTRSDPSRAARSHPANVAPITYVL